MGPGSLIPDDGLRLSQEIYYLIKEHATQEDPRECVGALGFSGDRPALVIRLRNAAEEPLSGYYVDPIEQLATMETLEDVGLRLGAVYHSHPRGHARPSLRDVQMAYPGILHLIVGMGEGLVTRAYFAPHPGRIWEVPLEIV